MAYQIGLTTEQFWQATPVEFLLMVEGYQRRTRSEGEYFRQMYAMLSNQWQAEHAKNPELIEPQDVLQLPGDKKRRVSRTVNGQRIVARSDKELADVMRRVNAQHKASPEYIAQVTELYNRQPSIQEPGQALSKTLHEAVLAAIG